MPIASGFGAPCDSGRGVSERCQGVRGGGSCGSGQRDERIGLCPQRCELAQGSVLDHQRGVSPAEARDQRHALGKVLLERGGLDVDFLVGSRGIRVRVEARRGSPGHVCSVERVWQRAATRRTAPRPIGKRVVSQPLGLGAMQPAVVLQRHSTALALRRADLTPHSQGPWRLTRRAVCKRIGRASCTLGHLERPLLRKGSRKVPRGLAPGPHEHPDQVQRLRHHRPVRRACARVLQRSTR